MTTETKFKRTEMGMIPEGWKVAKLGDLGEVNRGRSRHRPRWAPELYGGTYPFIQTGDIKASGGRIVRYSQTYSEEGLAQSRMWPADTMCITIAANIAETGILTFPACFPDSIVGFIADRTKCNIYFIEHMFRYLRTSIQHEASGSVQDNINLETLDRLEFPLPPLPEQNSIEAILSSLDDKIELNKKMNKTLEAIAESIFKHWFIDFEFPNGAGKTYKSSGGEMVYNDELEKEIPKTWKVGSILDCASILSGGTPRTEVAEYWGGEIRWVSAKDVTGSHGSFILDTERTITQLGIDNSSAKLLPKNTTVVTARGVVGSYCILSREMAINQTNYGLKAKSEDSNFFVFFSISSLVTQMKQRSYGTIFDTITTKTFEDMKIAIPPSWLITSFEEKIRNIMARILVNLQEYRSLATIRDALLPKLMSGKIRAPVEVR